MAEILVVLRRARDMVITVFIVASVMFFLLHAIPGSPAIAILGTNAPLESIEQLNRQLGFGKPIWEQYGSWLWNALHGDLGFSLSQSRGVASAIADFMVPTLLVAAIAMVLSVLLAVPLAVRTVSHPSALLSRVLLFLSSALLAVPGFWLALVLVLFFAVRIRAFPVSGYVAPTEDLWSFTHHVFLAVVVLLAYQVPLLVLTLRESLAGELLNAYARTARAKGGTERDVMYRHLLRNGFLPTLTVLGSNFSHMLGGVIILETIFSIPGLGYLLNSAIGSRDYNLVLGITLFTVVVTILVNLTVDLLYAVLDPRVRSSR
ncbi:ABC transporter permease [Micromonospora chalcea]|uniref:ABC transporter permease n=1 Tax=Micromonospora chalcea TaxID=1874 RepID=UPI00380C6BCF